MIFRYAACIIEGIVDENGMGLISIESDKLNIDKTTQIGADRNNTKPFKYLKQVSFKAYYFIFQPEFIPPQQKSRITELSEEIGGIRLYKNGFRVLPYGEPYFDWLKLDESVRKRTILPVHGNHNFFGFVEVNENTGLLEETSSREGLQENEAFRELQNFVYRGLITGVLEVASIRSIKTTTNQKDWDKKFERPNFRIRDVAEKIAYEAEQYEATAKELSEYSSKTEADLSRNNFQTAENLKTFAKELVEAVKDQEFEEKKLIEEIAMLRVLASLGLTIGEFTHEIRHYLTTLEGNVNLLNSDVKDGFIKSRISKLKKNIQTLSIYASYFDEAVSNNVTRELAPQELRDVITNFLNVIKSDAQRAAITIDEPVITGYDLFSSAMHPSEWSSILFNLYTNSKKAIKRAGTSGRIFVKAGKVNEKIFVEFADNGDGIPENIQDRVFDAFFTTSSPAGHFAGEKEEILGTGLGLKIVSDIVASYNGSIEIVTAPADFSTNFRIELPEASEKEIENL